MSDRSDLLTRFREGDPDALRRLLDEQHGRLRAHVERCLPAYLRRRVAVSDIVQETRIVAFKRCADFEERGENSFRNWVLGIAEMRVRKSLEQHLGTAKRSAGAEVTRADRRATAQYAGSGPTPSQVVIGAELAELARQAMSALSADAQEVLRLTREEHLSMRDAAQRMGRSYEATRKLYARALRRFASALDSLRGDVT